MFSNSTKPATRRHGGLHPIVQLGGERSENIAKTRSDQREVALDCFRRAQFLGACAGFERGAEAIRILAMAAHYADRGAEILRAVP